MNVDPADLEDFITDLKVLAVTTRLRGGNIFYADIHGLADWRQSCKIAVHIVRI
jgi:hypothetical protein